jgi:hypothetical protein
MENQDKDIEIHAIRFDARIWKADDAVKWLDDNEFRTHFYRRSPDYSGHFITYDQRSKTRYKSFKYLKNDEGITIVFGYLRPNKKKAK